MHEERRQVSSAPQFVVRASGKSQDVGTIVGLAALFNSETVIAGELGWREQIASGAFDSALSRQDDVRCLWNHDHGIVLGRTRSHTLRLSKTARGLAYAVDLPRTQAAQDVKGLISRGDVSGSSFGFRVLADQWDTRDVKEGKLPLRTITDVELFDVSPVTFPAYQATSVSARKGGPVEQLRLALARERAWRDPTLGLVASRA